MNMPRRIERRVVGERLVWYRQDAISGYWDAHWRGQATEAYYEPYMRGALDEYEDLFMRFLPKEGKILEAGCGMGQYVVAMRARGYDMEGVDTAEDTVKCVKSLFPDLPVSSADVTDLPCSAETYAGYVSLGVVEHRAEGPEPFFEEATRVVAPGGVLLFTVPRFSPLRRWKFALGMFRGGPSDLHFYQYAFKPDEFVMLMKAWPLEIVHVGALSGIKGLRDEWPFFRRWFDASRRGIRHAIVIRLYRYLPFLTVFTGHMLVVVARRRPD